MQVNIPSQTPSSIANPSIQGYSQKKNILLNELFSFLSDRAARRFGIFLLGTLAVITIGAGIGIGVGNLAHYRELKFLSTGYFI